MMGRDKAANAVIAKVRAMYGDLLTFSQYAELARKQNLQEIAAYLKESTPYGPELEDVRGSIIYRQQLETILRRHTLRQYARIAPYAAGIKNGVPAYILLDAEIEMILRCLKGIVTIQQENFIADLPAFIQPYVGFHVLSLANAHTVSQLIEILERTPYGPLLEKCAAQKEGPLYSRFVQMVYEWYFDTLMKRANASKGKARKDLESLISARAEIMNLSSVYRLKKFYQMPSEKIRGWLYPYHWRLSQKETDQLVQAENADIFLQRLLQTSYGPWIDTQELFLEGQLNQARRVQEEKMIHFSTDPHVIYTAFMLLCYKEMENIIRVIEGVHYGMKPEKIESLLSLGKKG